MGVIPGAFVPFVLKEEASEFRLVGECYVQNFMGKKAFTRLDASQMENIVIK